MKKKLASKSPEMFPDLQVQSFSVIMNPKCESYINQVQII